VAVKKSGVVCLQIAERVGFEPTIQLPVYRVSSWHTANPRVRSPVDCGEMEVALTQRIRKLEKKVASPATTGPLEGQSVYQPRERRT
jgi:hypothetical protein